VILGKDRRNDRSGIQLDRYGITAGDVALCGWSGRTVAPGGFRAGHRRSARVSAGEVRDGCWRATEVLLLSKVAKALSQPGDEKVEASELLKACVRSAGRRPDAAGSPKVESSSVAETSRFQSAGFRGDGASRADGVRDCRGRLRLVKARECRYDDSCSVANESVAGRDSRSPRRLGTRKDSRTSQKGFSTSKKWVREGILVPALHIISICSEDCSADRAFHLAPRPKQSTGGRVVSRAPCPAVVSIRRFAAVPLPGPRSVTASLITPSIERSAFRRPPRSCM